MKSSLRNQKNLSFFEEKASSIHKLHRNQTVDDVLFLNKKYECKNIFSKKMNVWDAIENLAFVSDPTDKELYSVSQWVHTLQVVESMEESKVDDLVYIVGWMHDLGKLLLLTDEAPENIVCDNFVISGKEGSGLDNCVIQWNHDEFIYNKLKDTMDYEYLWLMRYHSINVKSCEKYFSQQDRLLVEKMLMPFKKHDKDTKSLYNFPKLDLDKHRKIVESYFSTGINL